MEDRQFPRGHTLHGSCQHRWLRNIAWSTFVIREWVATPATPATPGLNISRFPPFPALTLALDTRLWSFLWAAHFESFVFNCTCWPSVTRWLPVSMTPSSISVLAAGIRQQIPRHREMENRRPDTGRHVQNIYSLKKYAPPQPMLFTSRPPDARF